jgi:hypothetical protein
MFYAHPQADDLFMTAQLNAGGLMKFVKDDFTVCGGRWAYYLLDGACLAIGEPINDYPWRLLAATLALIPGYYALWRMLLGREPKRKTILALALSVLALSWTSVPSPGETTYWFAGSLYQWSISFLILIVWGVSCARGGIFGVIAAAGLITPTLFATGAHEMASAMACCVMLAGTCAAFIKKTPNRLAWMIVFMATIAGTMILFRAPGNFARAASFPLARQPLHACSLFLKQSAFYLTQWIFDPRLLAGTAAFLLNPYIGRLRPAWIDWKYAKIKWVMPLAWAGFMGAWFGIPSWITGYELPTRVVVGAHTTFLVGWICCLFAWTRRPESEWSLTGHTRVVAERAAIIIFSAAMLFTGNFPIGVKDLFARAPKWSESMHARYDAIRQAKLDGESELIFSPASEMPHLFSQQDSRADKTFYINVHNATFWKLKSISVTESSDPAINWKYMLNASDVPAVNAILKNGGLTCSRMTSISPTPNGLEFLADPQNGKITIQNPSIDAASTPFLRIHATGVKRFLCYWDSTFDIASGKTPSEDRRQFADLVNEDTWVFDLSSLDSWKDTIGQIHFLIWTQPSKKAVLRDIEIGTRIHEESAKS